MDASMLRPGDRLRYGGRIFTVVSVPSTCDTVCVRCAYADMPEFATLSVCDDVVLDKQRSNGDE